MTAKQLHTAQQRFERETQTARRRRDEMIRQALADGMTQRQVAAATGLSPGRIGQIALGRR